MGGMRGAWALLLVAALAAPVGWAPGTGLAVVETWVTPEGVVVHHVHIAGLAYDPDVLTIDEGDTVEWHNHDFVTHTATDDGGAWDTGDVPNGESRSLTFDGAASYTYTCIYHPSMHGSLEVQGAANQPPEVAITAPAEGATLEGTASVEGTASDPDGSVASVEVRIDGGAWEAASGTTSWSFAWDTTTVADGAHTVEARATDDQGSTAMDSRGVEVANPPTVAITSPEDGATVGGAATVLGTASDPGPGGAVALVEVRIDGGPWLAAEGTASWSFAWDTLPEANGAHVLEARSSDGALLSAIASRTLNVDNPANDPPTVAITSPADGATLEGTATVSGTAADPEGVLTKVEVRFDGGPWQLATGTTSWSFEWDTTTVADGARLVEARATDNAANTAMDTRTVLVLNPPSVAIAAPADGTEVEGTVSVTGTASDPTQGGGIASVEVRIDGGAWQPATGTASWSFAWDTTAFADGARTLEARATDTDGNTALAPARSVSVANAPVVAITSPDGSAELEGIVLLEGTASDTTQGGSIAKVEVRIDGGPWRDANGTGPWSFSWHSREVADGPHTLEARSSDGALFSELARVDVVTDNFKADLVVTEVAAEGGLFSQNVTATVRNDGDEAAGAFVVRLEYLSAQGAKSLGNVTVPGLAIGATAEVAVTWNTLGKLGNFTLVAIADAGNAVEEHREDNNTGQGFACVPPVLGVGCLLPRVELL